MTTPTTRSSNGQLPKPGNEKGSTFDYTHDLMVGENGRLLYDFTEPTSRIMDTMLRESGTAAKLEQVLALPILGAPLRIVGQKGDKGEAEWLTEALERPANAGGMSTPLRMIVAQMCGAFVHRKTYFEKVFAAREVAGRTALVYDKLAWRPPATCEAAYDKESGAFRGFRQQSAPLTVKAGEDGWIDIPAPYAFVFTHGVRRHPLKGQSELDVAVWAWQTTQKVLWLWLRFLERNALPLAVATSDDADAGKNTAQQVVALKGSGALYKPRNVDLATLDTAGGADAARQYQECLRWLEAKATESVLAGFTDLSSSASEGRGSFALSKDASDFFLRARSADAAEMSDQLTGFVAADLIRLNRGASAVCPRVEIGPLAEADTATAVALLQSLAGAPTTRAPDLFVEELVVLVAKRLGMDVDAMRQAAHRASVEAKAKAQAAQRTEAAAQVAGVAAQVGVATRAAQGANRDRPANKSTAAAGGAAPPARVPDPR